MSANVDGASSLASARALRRGLRTLGATPAPSGLLAAVLGEIGIQERYLALDTPIGLVYVAFAGQRISAVVPAADDASFERTYRVRHGRPVRRADPPPADLLAAIRQHLGGVPAQFDLDLRAVSEFERAVLLKAREIPHGEVRPYGWIAREIGRPGAVRAVGSALNKNPIPLLIPCHRVVKSDGQIGEYAFGPAAKRTLLAAEGLDLDRLTALARAGVRVLADEQSGLFCHPTCHTLRDVPAARLRQYRTVAAARAAGFRACPACRPAAEAV